MSSFTSSTNSSPILHTADSDSPIPRPVSRKGKSKSLSLPPFPSLPRRLSLASPISPSKRRNSSRTESSLTMSSPYTTHAHSTQTSHILSPSKLPSTDSMSYFPPFEDMGSDASSTSHGDGCEAQSSSAVAGPSRCPSPSRDTTSHGKGRSLGSLANFMAWATFSPASETPPDLPPLSASNSTGMILPASNPSDGDRIQALSRKFTTRQAKRRVLEPMASEDGGRGVSLLGLTTTRMEVDHEGLEQRRRAGSEMDVERMMRAGRDDMPSEDEEGDVERMVGWLPARPRALRHNLSLPPPLHLPNWRFPIPSPPITSLSPNIPLEFFQFEILNPASTSPSPVKHPSTFSDLHMQDLDDIEGSLTLTDTGSGPGSIASTDSASSNPATPDRSPPRKAAHRVDPRFWTPISEASYTFRKKSRFRLEGDDEEEEDGVERLEMFLPEKIKLRRTSSSGSKASCDSNTTIKVREGEITPRLGKGWKAVQAG